MMATDTSNPRPEWDPTQAEHLAPAKQLASSSAVAALDLAQDPSAILLDLVKRAGSLALTPEASQLQLKSMARLRSKQSLTAGSLQPVVKLAASLLQKRFNPEALALYRALLVQQQQLFGEQSLDVATSRINLAEALRRVKELDQAETHLEQAILLRKKLCGPDHPLTAMALNALAKVLRDSNKDEASNQAAKEALEIFQTHKLSSVRMKSLDDGKVLSLAKARSVSQSCIDPMELHDPNEVLAEVIVRNLDTGETARLHQVEANKPAKHIDPLELHDPTEVLATMQIKNLDTGQSASLDQADAVSTPVTPVKRRTSWFRRRKSSTSSIGSDRLAMNTPLASPVALSPQPSRTSLPAVRHDASKHAPHIAEVFEGD
eukprot:TRINITY_DN6183_c0_g1_i3.p1 TRINITY_DN6183_c0_g1~~TRINITY_DN6183_c0_g1_i3.p1  ORF type:complete len:376 (+),score=78.05 TRINITY_DN6183_c0_g1_i3:139-1266(+)